MIRLNSSVSVTLNIRLSTNRYLSGRAHLLVLFDSKVRLGCRFRHQCSLPITSQNLKRSAMRMNTDWVVVFPPEGERHWQHQTELKPAPTPTRTIQISGQPARARQTSAQSQHRGDLKADPSSAPP